MKRVSEIQRKRQDMFFKMRMRAHKATQKSVIKATIKSGVTLLVPDAADKNIALANATRKIAQRQKAEESKMQN